MKISKIVSKIRSIFEKKKPPDKPFSNDLDRWNLACVAMDTLEDTLLALEYYEKYKGSNLDGGKYLRLYGLLQAIFLQQDAIMFLYEVFKGPLTEYNLSAWKEIRDLRNLTIGHPMNKDNSKRCYISRVTVSKYEFQYLVWDKTKKKDEFANANLKKTINEYKEEASRILQDILCSLK